MIPKQFSLEHIPRSLSPTGKTESAPKGFKVFGLRSEFDQEPFEFGEFEFDAINGNSLQFFQVQNVPSTKYHLVELEIFSNHGHPDYTCLYRFRVHG